MHAAFPPCRGSLVAFEEETLKPYFVRIEELSVNAGCLLWGFRVVIPAQVRDEVLNIPHESLPNTIKMKSQLMSCVRFQKWTHFWK